MNSSKRATLQDIADHLQLSRSSVALALRTTKDECPLAPETWTLIQAAAKQLSYRPNRHAQSLSRGRANCIGIISHGAPGLGLFSGRLVEFIGREMGQKGQDLLLLDASGPESAWMGKLEDGRIDGALLLPPAPHALIELPRKPHLPLIAVNIHTADSPLSCIVPDDAGAIAMAYAHLRSLGHRRIAYYVDTRNNFAHHSARVRQESFRRESLAQDGAAGPVYSDVGSAVAAVRTARTGPTAFVCYNDQDALRVTTACLTSGLRVPEDVSVVGINDDPYTESMTPALTTISLEPAAIAKVASEAILGEIDGHSSGSGVQTVPVKLLARASSGPVPIGG